MEKLIDYILSDDFNNRVEAVFGLLALFSVLSWYVGY